VISLRHSCIVWKLVRPWCDFYSTMKTPATDLIQHLTHSDRFEVVFICLKCLDLFLDEIICKGRSHFPDSGVAEQNGDSL
jgi:hypothetical protein